MAQPLFLLRSAVGVLGVVLSGSAAIAQQDSRFALHEAISKTLLPEGSSREFLILLDPAIPVDPGSAETTKIIARLGDLLPSGFFESEFLSLISVLEKNVDRITIDEKKAELTEAEQDLLFEDDEQKVPTAAYTTFVEQQKAVASLESELKQTNASDRPKVELLRSRLQSANLLLRSTERSQEFEAAHRKLMLAKGTLSKAALQAAFAKSYTPEVFPPVDEWTADSGFLTVTFPLRAPFAKADYLGTTQVDSSTQALYSTVPASELTMFSAAGNRTDLPSPNAARIELSIKRILIRSTDHPIDLLLADQRWQWKGDSSHPKFATGKPPVRDNQGLVAARVHSLLIARRISIRSGHGMNGTTALLAAQSDANRVPLFITVPMRNMIGPPESSTPLFCSAISEPEVVISQPMVIGAIASILDER